MGPGVAGAEDVYESLRSILDSISRIVVGLGDVARLLFASMLANGHVLLEGVPGVAKTTMVKAVARLMGLLGYERVISGVPFRGYARIQFTPDLLPSDITGSLVWNPRELRFEPRFGPIFAYLVLADEINRASPRTQSALLEAMQERQVTIGGVAYRLEERSLGKWFLVVATQNPVEQEGTFPLPEAQLDRFMVRLLVGPPPSLEDEVKVYRLHLGRLGEPLEELEPLVDPEWLARAQEEVARVEVPPDILEAVARIVRLTRPEVSDTARDLLALGASPRAGVMLVRYAQALAYTRGSSSVAERDVLEALVPVLNHRLIPRVEAVVEKGATPQAKLEVVLEAIDAAAEAVLGSRPPRPW